MDGQMAFMTRKSKMGVSLTHLMTLQRKTTTKWYLNLKSSIFQVFDHANVSSNCIADVAYQRQQVERPILTFDKCQYCCSINVVQVEEFQSIIEFEALIKLN